ncbi:S-adenosyl-L-methionine-dependent methyltransferase [Kalaharituber pfeilii]|nr:S-adenosyl-L-methionine-dependent methyltransferase [Kalaharituber pfeilii]
MGSSQSSLTTSIASSVFSFTYANGRRYHSDRFSKGEYFLPNDETEQDRLDIYHHIFLLLLGGKLYTAPLDNPQHVLDVGTGTGIWAIDFADQHPESQVLGNDLSPIQPKWVPPNLKFEVDDMEEEWAYHDDFFDYIHIRSLSGSFRNWDAVLAQAYKKTKPGGYIEFQDYGSELFLHDGTQLGKSPDEPPVGQFFYYVTTAGEKQGRQMVVARGTKERLEKAGFVDVEEHLAIWPLGPWPKDKRLKQIGRWAQVGAKDSTLPFCLHLLTKEGWTYDQIKVFSDRITADYDVGKYYCHGWFVHGRKPERKTKPEKH